MWRRPPHSRRIESNIVGERSHGHRTKEPLGKLSGIATKVEVRLTEVRAAGKDKGLSAMHANVLGT